MRETDALQKENAQLRKTVSALETEVKDHAAERRKAEQLQRMLNSERERAQSAAATRDEQHQLEVNAMKDEFAKLLEELDRELTQHQWIGSDNMSLADIALAPYITRLEHLHMQGLWSDRARFNQWYKRLKMTQGYQQGLADWFNPNYLKLMDKAGAEAWPKIMLILDQR